MIFVIFVPISVTFFYFFLSIWERSWLSYVDEQSIMPINLFNLFNSFWTDPWSLILDSWSSILDPKSNDPIILDRVFPGKIDCW